MTHETDNEQARALLRDLWPKPHDAATGAAGLRWPGAAETADVILSVAADVHAWTGVEITPEQTSALLDRHPELRAEFLNHPAADTPTRETVLGALTGELLGEPWPSGASDAERHTFTARLRIAAAAAGYAVRPVPHSPLGRIEAALDLLNRHGQHGGESHHQTWLLDQVVRALTGEAYRAWVGQFCQDDDGNDDAHEWKTGTPPEHLTKTIIR